MSTDCGIFWDIENIDIPKKSSADIVITLIKTNIIQRFNLILREFYVVGNLQTIKAETVNRLRINDANFEEAGPGRNAGDYKIKNRMVEFIERFQKRCSIILITGDSGIGKCLKEFRINPLFKIYSIRLEYSYGEELAQLADCVFVLKANSLEEDGLEYQMSSQSNDLSSEFLNKYFVKITCDQYFSPKILDEIRNDLSSYGGTFAIVTSVDDIWCSFDEIADARSALGLKGRYNYRSKEFNIDVTIQKPSQEVINLMTCAKLSYRQLITNSTFNMSKYKSKTNNQMDRRASTSSTNSSTNNDFIETINNMTETFNNMQSIYSTFKSSSVNKPSNSRSKSNDEGCNQS